MVTALAPRDRARAPDVDVDEARAIASDRADAETLTEGERVAIVPKEWFEAFARSFAGATSMKRVDGGEEGESAVGAIDTRELLLATASTTAVRADDDDDARDEAILKPALAEGVDFEIVRERAMVKLEGWYGHVEGSRSIYRTCVRRGSGIYVDVYGLGLVAKFGDEERAVEVRRESAASELVRVVKKAFAALKDVDDADVRVADYLYGNRGEVLTSNPRKLLEEFHLLPGQEVLVETKSAGGSWNEDEDSVIALPGTSEDEVMEDTTFGCDVSLTPKNDVTTCAEEAKVGTRGKAGLSNLGNTCFMNSALQCLSHSSLLTDYFLSDKYEVDINTDNPIGMGGELAKEYANLIGALWRDGALTVTPRKFKSSLARFAPQFSGYMQQDAQELLAFLLDGLHEDLNRVKNKPYATERDAEGRSDEDVANESWEAHTARNNSCIVDTFQGQYRSTLVCPSCSNKSVKFDPFMYLSIPVPSARERMIKVTLVSYGDELSAITYGLKLPKNGEIAMLLSALCEAADIDTMDERVVLCEVYNHRMEKTLSNMSYSLTDIRERDVIYAHRLPAIKDNDNVETVDTVLVHRKELNQNKTPYSHVSSVAATTMVRFGFPWIVPVSVPKGTKAGPDHARFVEKEVEKFSAKFAHTNSMEKSCSPTTSGDTEGSASRRAVAEKDSRLFKMKYTNKSASASFHEYGSTTASTSDSHEMQYTIASSMHCVAIDWSSKALSQFFDEELLEREIEEHPSVKENAIENSGTQGTPLASCIESFIQEEPLGKDDMWYCKQCKDHVQAMKKLDLWRMPPILVMHLKRFSYSRTWRDKIDTLIDFPLNTLDMTPYVLPNASSGPAPIYDLYAVVNHFGGMGGGHYTAYTRHAEEGTWHLYDDSRCTAVDVGAALNNSAAYVLFYKRRDVPMRQAMSRAGSLCNMAAMDSVANTRTPCDDDDDEPREMELN
jgi:ubiquitin C-terminal hydrolase